MAKQSGWIAVFKSEHETLNAARAVRDKKVFKGFDVFTPYPVHGMDDAMGLKPSWLPWVTFIAGLTGAIAGLGFEIWTSAYDWPINVGGKPFDSLPAFIPICFECTVLFGGVITILTLFGVCCRMPNFKPRILHPEITNDRYVVYVPANPKGMTEAEVNTFLHSLNPEELKPVTEI